MHLQTAQQQGAALQGSTTALPAARPSAGDRQEAHGPGVFDASASSSSLIRSIDSGFAAPSRQQALHRQLARLHTELKRVREVKAVARAKAEALAAENLELSQRILDLDADLRIAQVRLPTATKGGFLLPKQHGCCPSRIVVSMMLVC